MRKLIRFDDAPATVDYLSSALTIASSTSYTFATSFGAESSARRIAVGVGYMTAGGFVTGVTIGGVAAMLIALSSGTVGSIWIAHVPTGTSGNVVVTCGGGQQCGVVVWRIGRQRSSSYVDSGFVDSAATTSPSTVNLNAVKRGVVVGLVALNNNANTTWTGLTENTDIGSGSGNLCISGASEAFATDHLPLTVTATKSISTRPTLVVASFR